MVSSQPEEEPFGLSVITVPDCFTGPSSVSPPGVSGRYAFVQKVIDLFPVLTFDTAAARVYATTMADLQKKGRCGAHDLMIGSTAISLGSTRTFNQRFENSRP